MRRLASLAALAVPSLLAAGIAAPAAMAADDCPNAAVRAQQGSTHLPNCLAYERVSPADKNGSAPVPHTKIAADGNGLLFFSPADLDQSKSSLYGEFRAHRGAEGWLTESLNPEHRGPVPMLPDRLVPAAASDDLTRVAMQTAYPLATNDQGRHSTLPGGPGSYDIYVREPDGSFTWVAPERSTPDTASQQVDVVDASSDLRRIAIVTARQFDPRVTTSDVNHVYVWTRSATHLVTVLPDGRPASALDNISGTVNRVSVDGRRVAFVDSSTGVPKVYVRVNADDPTTAQTRDVAVGPNGEPCADDGASLVGLSEDGTQVLFSCRSELIAGAGAGALYQRDLDGGPSAVRLIGSPALGSTVLAASADFSRVYLQGSDAISLLRDGTPEQIAQGGSAVRTAVSPDGEYFAFQTTIDQGLPGVHVGLPNTEQTYRYSARTGELRCISCQQNGSPTTGRGVLFEVVDYVANREPLSMVGNDGSVAFTSAAGLDPADTNGVFDAYAWVDGRQVLLSGGRHAQPSVAYGTAQGGAVFYFTTPDSLVPNDRDGGAYDIYTARPGGGFLVPDPPTECTGSCRPSVPERPGLPGLGSTDVLGRGNLVEEVTKAKPSPSRAKASLTVSRSVRGTSTKVRVQVSRAGSIRVSGAGLRQTTVKAKKTGTYRVTVRLSANGVKQQRSRGRLTTKVTARFTPQSGGSVSARKSVTFTAKKGGR